MDTQTVLDIIKIIDADLNYLDIQYKEGMNDVEYYSAKSALTELADHLQSYIEAQLNAEELKTGE